MGRLDGNSHWSPAALRPPGYTGEADDIARSVVCPASGETKFVTGSELMIDGGYSCR
ncbi:MAG: SDR family oxidoreductase [Rhodanobacter sp.]|jgi:NAD(P)-dependent dehydrogenase (short-subunit alcohol dehydrogenase family)|uniref:SDR family oxidoreductase n=1 Tax=Rhodanobacter sp. KK11 TaxID=3083255 RepID=UPI0029660B45|nr:SDR family oxidoreductase [Rhodanobacter sp. KK11]MDW2981728.1 SDR family oxidoreductase [Rhodanobacter sp. KK11]